MMVSVASAAAGAFVATVVAILALRRLAPQVGLVDVPGGRKTHAGPVPLVGGLGMAMGLALGIGLGGEASALQPYLASALLLAVIGALDDNFALSPGVRLFAQVVAVLPMVLGAGVRIMGFGDLLGVGPLEVGGAALPVTVFVTVSAINAFNLVDGLDGVAGGIALAALAVCLAAGITVRGTPDALLAAVLAASVAGFLLFNAPVPWDNAAYRCFMGDAGSTMLGFSFAWLLVGASQGPHARIAPVVALWIVLVPATDLLWSVSRRALRRQSILRADGEHLHHALRRAGLPPAAVAATLVVVTLGSGAIGIALQRRGMPESMSFAAWWLAAGLLVGVSGAAARR